MFAKSRVPLVKWFQAVAVMLSNPQMSAGELASGIGIARVPTVRAMRSKICTAFTVKNASQLLAGLDHVYMPGT